MNFQMAGVPVLVMVMPIASPKTVAMRSMPYSDSQLACAPRGVLRIDLPHIQQLTSWANSTLDVSGGAGR